jgi:hypothetical protein
MNIELTVLRTMLRLARRLEPAVDEALALRIPSARPAEIRGALRRLEASALVERREGRAARLTMAGLTAAVALSAPRPKGADSNALSAARPKGADSNALSAARPKGADSNALLPSAGGARARHRSPRSRAA